MTFALAFPAIDPVLFEIGPIVIRWYALAYIAGLLIGWRLMRYLAAKPPYDIHPDRVDDFLTWATIGVIIGGRLGYVLFYNFDYYMANPGAIVKVWQGGMSFHGGLAGVAVAIYFYARQCKIPVLAFADLVAVVAPVGLFFGRLANFINAELYGRVTDAPWGMVFPNAGPDPRHPSQLYEAALEGALLFVVMMVLWRLACVRGRFGFLMGTFLAGYGAARFFIEFFREPDAQIGFLSFGSTMGQWLSVPLIALGLYLMARARPHSEKAA